MAYNELKAGVDKAAAEAEAKATEAGLTNQKTQAEIAKLQQDLAE
jgi:hypothetical protein